MEAAEPLREAAVEPLRDVNKSESVQAEADQRGGAAAAVAGWRRHRAAAPQAQSTGGAAAEPMLA